MRPLLPIALAAALAFAGTPSAAQMIVHDPVSYIEGLNHRLRVR